MPATRQQTVLNLFRDQIIASIGVELGDRVYDMIAPDDFALPLATYSVTTDQDIALLGDERINETFIQVSFFGEKSLGVSTLRTLVDNFIEYIDGYTLSNGMLVRVISKGFTLINDLNNQNVMIICEFQIR